MRKQRMVLLLAAGLIAALAAAVLFSSCSSGDSTPSGTVALYVTDDISEYQQVIATINRVDLLHTGSGASCNLFTGPTTTLDIANLAGVLQLIDVTSCAAAPYNRIHVEFAKSVDLRDQAGNPSTCTFTSYKDESNHPNTLACNEDRCTLDINGAVNVLVVQQNKLALDFDLKAFDAANFGDPQACTVTLKVSPLHGHEIAARGHPEALTGLVSGLSTTDRIFTLTKGNDAFTVRYSGITTSQQPGIDTVLRRAQDDQLRTRVLASQIDLANRTVTASALYVKVQGAVAPGGLDATNHVLTVNYGSGRSINADYSTAIVKGLLAEGVWVEVKLTGFDGVNFIAGKVEVEATGTATDD